MPVKECADPGDDPVGCHSPLQSLSLSCDELIVCLFWDCMMFSDAFMTECKIAHEQIISHHSSVYYATTGAVQRAAKAGEILTGVNIARNVKIS